MGRSKARKPRVQTTNRKSALSREIVPTTEVTVFEQALEFDACATKESCVDSISNFEQSLEATTELVLSLEEHESRSCETEAETVSIVVEECNHQSEQISAILTQVECWMDETQDVKDPLEQKLNNDVVIDHDKLDVVLPHFGTPQMISMAMLDERFEQMTRQLEHRVERLFCSLETKIDQQLTNFGGANHSIPSAELKSEAQSVIYPGTEHKSNKSEVHTSIPESDWERRKREMLVDFGLSKDEIEQIVPKQSERRNPDSRQDSEMRPTDDIGQANVEMVEAAVCFTSFEIDQLKEQLTAKLREAELELSINRAKLLQESTALEQRLADVSRREAALKSKYAEIEGTNKTGLLDRITRHLSRKAK